MILFIILAIVLGYSVILHEIAHGAAAYLLGDPTAKEQKRLTLNPIRHIDLIGTIVLPAILILTKSPAILGWAKPVPFDPRYFKNPKLGISLVSLAGPLTNFALAAIFGLLFRFAPQGGLLGTICLYGLAMNAALGLFNLIPIPPMDGSKVIGVFLPPRIRRIYFSLDRWGFLIIFALLYFGLPSKLIAPFYTTLIRFFTVS
jgi:Zn-dependent protease